jgi:transcriptional regulator with XRE-family HTH domain
MTERESDGAIFGRRLRELRTGRGLSQRALAEMIDSTHPFISQMENGATLPGLAMLMKLADALDCNVTELVVVLDRKPRRGRRSMST